MSLQIKDVIQFCYPLCLILMLLNGAMVMYWWEDEVIKCREVNDIFYATLVVNSLSIPFYYLLSSLCLRYLNQKPLKPTLIFLALISGVMALFLIGDYRLVAENPIQVMFLIYEVAVAGVILGLVSYCIWKLVWHWCPPTTEVNEEENEDIYAEISEVPDLREVSILTV